MKWKAVRRPCGRSHRVGFTSEPSRLSLPKGGPVYRGLRGVNCIYDDGTGVSMDAGPCQDVNSSGAYLVDIDNQAQNIDVTTPYPTDYGPLLLGAVALLGVLATMNS